jgi:threonine dehydrogenase-like Zn-dependent dehydrogenase
LAESFGVGVVGTGYVGLVTGSCLSHLGHGVVCIDRDEGRISALKAGRMTFYEPGLEELVSQSLKQHRLSFADSGSLARLVGEAEVIFVAVDTPQGEDGSADLSNVADVARGIGWALARPESPRRKRPLVVVNKSTLTVYGGGTQSRSVQYVDDLIEGVLRLMRSPEDRPVNIGNPVEYSVRQVAEIILEISDSKSGKVHEPLPEDDPKQRRPYITRARETLGWEPRVQAEEGLKLTFEWFAQRLSPSEALPPAGQ